MTPLLAGLLVPEARRGRPVEASMDDDPATGL
ncbi:MAG: hypothetical protein QOC80_1767, partial [Frankiaceae bacterium]|nr:hypothetical protein [Frankiaceae bacterium]